MKNKQSKQYRQGDIYIEEVSSLPKGLKKRKNLVILYGEATNHSHRLLEGSVFDGKNGAIYLELLKNTQIVHDEHGPIDLPKGVYKVSRQREYVMKDMVRVVVD